MWKIYKQNTQPCRNGHEELKQSIKNTLKAHDSTLILRRKPRDAGLLAISSSLLNASEDCKRNNKSDITGTDAIREPPFKTPFLSKMRANKQKKKSRNKAHPNLFDLKELDIEDHLRVGWDSGKGLLSVCEMRRNRNAALTTDSHAGNTDIPALNDLALAELEAERLALLVGY